MRPATQQNSFSPGKIAHDEPGHEGWQQPCHSTTQVNSGIVTERTLIKNLAAASDGPISVSGWVDTVRDQKKVQFVVLRDESGATQLVHPRIFTEDGTPAEDPIAETISALAQGTFLTATGELKHDERVKLGGVEAKLDAIVIAAAAIPETPIADDSADDCASPCACRLRSRRRSASREWQRRQRSRRPA